MTRHVSVRRGRKHLSLSLQLRGNSKKNVCRIKNALPMIRSESPIATVSLKVYALATLMDGDLRNSIVHGCPPLMVRREQSYSPDREFF